MNGSSKSVRTLFDVHHERSTKKPEPRTPNFEPRTSNHTRHIEHIAFIAQKEI